MWKNTYKDYKPDAPFTRHPIETGKGLAGCEMQEIYGWGHEFERAPQRKKGLLSKLLGLFNDIVFRK